MCILEAAILAKDGFNFVSAYPFVPLGVAPLLECVHPPLNTNLNAASESTGLTRLNLNCDAMNACCVVAIGW